MGKVTIATMESLRFMDTMKDSDSASRMQMRTTFMNCSVTKLRTVSTSLVQRWMMSPVWFFMCQAKGRRWMCAKSRLRMRQVKVSAALELLTMLT